MPPATVTTRTNPFPYRSLRPPGSPLEIGGFWLSRGHRNRARDRLGPSWVRHGLSPCLVETLGSGHIKPIKQVGIGGHRDHWVGMTETIGDDFYVLSLGDQNGSMAMSEVVISERSTDGSFHSGEPEPPAPVGTTDRAALGGREDPTFRVAPPGDVPAQLADKELGECDLANRRWSRCCTPSDTTLSFREPAPAMTQAWSIKE